MSTIFCIVDGMTDPGFFPGAYPALSRMEALPAVDTAQGEAPESLNCILHLLGVERVPPRLRGYAEALGSGIPVGKGDLILRGSWFSRDSRGHCAAPIPAPPELPGELPCRYYPLGGYKSLLVFPGLGGAAEAIETFPPYALEEKPAEALCPRGCEALQRTFFALLREERCLIPWGQSAPAALPPFPMAGTVISGTPVVRGIGRLLGMKVAEVPGATGDVDTDLNAKTAAALAAAETCPFVVLHLNGADEAGHRKNRAEKETFLRNVDSLVIRPLLSGPHGLVLTADHGTDPVTGLHLGVPQPVFARRIPGETLYFPPLFGKKPLPTEL